MVAKGGGIFDFDFFGYGAFANDIMSFSQHIGIDAFHGRLTPEAFSQSFANFLRGYEAVRPVSEREMAAIPFEASNRFYPEADGEELGQGVLYSIKKGDRFAAAGSRGD